MSEALNGAMIAIEPLLLERARANAPYATGAFVDGLESHIVGAGVGSIAGDLSIEVYSTADTPLMEWVLQGTSPHSIGEDGQFLYNPDDDFAAIGPVDHPGTAPYDFATPTLEQINDVAQEIIIRALADVFAL